MKTIKRAFTLLIAFAIAAGFMANANEALKREMRAAWVATVYCIDWPATQNNAAAQKAEINTYLDNLQAQNFNAIFFQVRSMCDAMYQSSYEPWSSYLTGTRGRDPGYDPLAYVVEQCHIRGIQCHAWVNPYRWSTGTDWNTAQDKDLKNKGMLLSYTNGSTTTIILNPGLPETRQRIVNVIEEIISNYDVDGVVFDDYFYPNGIPTNSSAPDYNLWNDSGVDMTLADWRRNNVNMMVRDVYNKIQEIKPEVRFGISPAGVAGTAATSAGLHGVTPCPTGSDWQYNGIFSDPLAWLEEGNIDYISPQLYWKTNHSTNPFGPLTDWWSYIAKHYGRHHYASHSISFFDNSNTTSDWAEVVKQINFSRQYTEDNCPGVVLYSIRYINGPRKTGLGEYLLANAFQQPAMIPAVTWKEAPGYSAPADLALDDVNLTWTEQQGTLVKYSVYAVPADVTLEQAKSTVYEGIRGDYLLGVTYKPAFSLPNDYLSGYWYAVCVIDGYGNESEPAIIGLNGDQPTPVTYNIEKVWEINNLNFLYTPDARQGFGMDGKFYINDKGSSTIYVVDQNGLTGETFEGGRNVGFSRDEAGNLVVSDAQFPDPWNTSSPRLKVINPTTGHVATHVLPAELTNFGRSDNMGFARGNLMEDGELFLVGASSGTLISRIKFTDGEIDTDESYLANCDDVAPNSGTLLNAYTDADGNNAVLYVTRNKLPIKMMADGDNFEGTAFSLPNKGATNGAFPFVWNGVDYVLYPTLNNYFDGFAVAQPNASQPLVYVPETTGTITNEYQADWLNAEVIDSRNVIIYQYFPGGHITVWKLTKQGGLLRGDANADRVVNITDVTTLINYLLSDNLGGIDLYNADCNFDETVNISDVIALIGYLLSDTWPN
jgi:uncharacterized lipoprotein YddW (UPF0748 family)